MKDSIQYLLWTFGSVVTATDCLNDMYPEISQPDSTIPADNVVVEGTVYTFKVPIAHNRDYFEASGGPTQSLDAC